MLSVRLTEAMERDLTQYCAVRKLTKSHVVQEALAEYLVAAQTPTGAKPAPEPDLSVVQVKGTSKSKSKSTPAPTATPAPAPKPVAPIPSLNNTDYDNVLGLGNYFFVK